jgi:hypothetical protein
MGVARISAASTEGLQPFLPGFLRAVPTPKIEKTPARFLSGRNSAMIRTCVKRGSFVNVVFYLFV